MTSPHYLARWNNEAKTEFLTIQADIFSIRIHELKYEKHNSFTCSDQYEDWLETFGEASLNSSLPSPHHQEIQNLKMCSTKIYVMHF